MTLSSARLLLYAPNVHTGGGLVLLKALLAAWQPEAGAQAWLDSRARELLTLPAGLCVHWVDARVSSRLGAQWALFRSAGPRDRVLCFHGLPPMMAGAARFEVFLQNRNYLGAVPLSSFGWRTRLRLSLEQWMFRAGRRHVHRYWVQTPSMAQALLAWWGAEAGCPPVQVFPFVPDVRPTPALSEASPTPDRPAPRWDFVYVADGESHKNHRRLVEAWVLLARQGIRPSLALTLGPRDFALRDWISAQARTHDLRIEHLGVMPHAELLGVYAQASALIFPSLSESFGLPLVEAAAAGCAIVASELDYVRDVCTPGQTFDPSSAISMARAVRRHLGQAGAPLVPRSAGEFLDALGQDAA